MAGFVFDVIANFKENATMCKRKSFSSIKAVTKTDVAAGENVTNSRAI
jgi:hypothetical protein